MLEYELLGFVSPGESEDYDIDNPTKQTEMLSLSLRKVLSSVMGEGKLTLRQTEESDYSGVQTSLDGVGAIILGFLDDAATGEYGEIPAVPQISSVVAGLVPALLSGGVSITAFIPILLPYIMQGVFHLLKARVLPAPTDAALQAIAAALTSEDGSITGIHYELLDAVREIKASVDSLDRLLQEVQEATPVAIMHTSEIDKVVYVTP